MPFEVLSPRGRDGARWQMLVEAIPEHDRDIHFRPEYAAVQDMLGTPAALAVFTGDGGQVIQPFVTRTAVGLPSTPIDVASPYGYGGPLAVDADDSCIAGFSAEFATWCRESGKVDEYCVLHPLAETHQRWVLRGVVDPTRKKDVVLMWLKGHFEGQYRRDRRAAMDRARAASVAVERAEPTPANVTTFCELYRATMLRKRASERWYFPEEYLRAHFDMGPRLASLFFARVDGDVEVASLVLHAGTTAYYHLTGNRMAHPKSGANDLLVHEVASWAFHAGYDRLHLGGGVTAAPDDSVLEYKAGFSKFRAPIYEYFRIFNEPRYAELCEAKRQQEIAIYGHEMESGFRPMYRREVSARQATAC